VDVDGSTGTTTVVVGGTQFTSSVATLLLIETPPNWTVATFVTRCPQLSLRVAVDARATTTARMCTCRLWPGERIPKLQVSVAFGSVHPLSEPASSIVQTNTAVPALPTGAPGFGPVTGVSVSVAEVLTVPTFVTVMVKPTVGEVDIDAVTNGASAVFDTLSWGDCGVGGGQARSEVVAVAATPSFWSSVAVAVFV
jgi:hypothetical protein